MVEVLLPEAPRPAGQRYGRGRRLRDSAALPLKWTASEIWIDDTLQSPRGCTITEDIDTEEQEKPTPTALAFFISAHSIPLSHISHNSEPLTLPAASSSRTPDPRIMPDGHVIKKPEDLSQSRWKPVNALKNSPVTLQLHVSGTCVPLCFRNSSSTALYREYEMSAIPVFTRR